MPSSPSAATTEPRSARTSISRSACSDTSARAASRFGSGSTPTPSAGRKRRRIGNPRFGKVELFPLPYIAFFEGLGPLVEVGGYVLTIVAASFGYLEWKY